MSVPRKSNLVLAAAALLLSVASACGGQADDASSADQGQDTTDVADSAEAEDTGAVSTPPVPEATAVGVPTGDPVSVTIGPEGGTLVSADAILTLVIPADAVSTPTEFGIEPITNNCPASIGGAYRLTPDGATFATPVELHFTYTDEDTIGTVSAASASRSRTRTGSGVA